jgi:DNA invertase Pin-like site-specific DNA recombinase
MVKAGMKVVAYHRVSTAIQGRSGLGIDAQREAVRRFLNGTGGFPPIKEFVETESGRKNNRPELAKALAACRVHRAVLVVAKIDRLARNAAFLTGLIDSGVDVLFCDLPHIPAGATGRFMLQQMASVAELEAGLISERTKAALAAKVARDGQWDRKAKHHLVPGSGQQTATDAVKTQAAQRAADIIPTIREIEATGITSATGIAKALNDRSVLTARGKEWHAVQVQRVMARAA